MNAPGSNPTPNRFSLPSALALIVGAALLLPSLGQMSGQPQQSASAGAASGTPQPGPVHALKVTVLSTMLTDAAGVGEWGFSALVEVAGKRLLFDAGGRPDTVLNNARELGIDLSGVEDAILSHHHWDHVTGLVTLRRELSKANPNALCRAHVGRGIFLERLIPPGAMASGRMSMAEVKSGYEALGGKFIEYAEPKELFAGVWLTGPVPRPYPEKNYPAGIHLRDPSGKLLEDNIPEDQSLVLDTAKGLVVLTGCGHAGLINILTYARQTVRPDTPVYAALGGFHLFAAKADALAWTADKLKGFGVAQILGAHCTGIEPVYYFRERLGLERKACVVGAVGASFDLAQGIHPGNIAQ
ncbi:MAG: MBL fold metallo-hydrolase [Verrucomicrobia bacterium]|nr:MBL fold metallo-hydrolase [Verrucomicrobiota bacterium]